MVFIGGISTLDMMMVQHRYAYVAHIDLAGKRLHPQEAWQHSDFVLNDSPAAVPSPGVRVVGDDLRMAEADG